MRAFQIPARPKVATPGALFANCGVTAPFKKRLDPGRTKEKVKSNRRLARSEVPSKDTNHGKRDGALQRFLPDLDPSQSA
jgi:hypothetical protein